MKKSLCFMVLMGTCVVLAGCGRDTMPPTFVLVGGEVERSHPKPMEGGYYSDWDPYAGSIEITPVKDVNPVQTQHVFIATVRDKDGEPLPLRRVEWMIAEGSVGVITEVDESGWVKDRGYKQTNTYAVSHSNRKAHVITRGNDDPSDDIHLEPGQTWAVVTSPTEGTTHMIAYAPGIFDWSKHKAFAKKHWYDVAWTFPPEATNVAGTTHKFVTKVTQHSDGAPLENYEVTYKILGGPAGSFAESKAPTATVMTDKQGLATVTLQQAKPADGTNPIQIDIVRPGNEKCCLPPVHIATGKTAKIWITPMLTLTKNAPATRDSTCEAIPYTFVVSNPGSAPVTNVKFDDPLPDGLLGPQQAKRLVADVGTLKPGESRQIRYTVTATRAGKFVNTATVKADNGLSAKATATTVVRQPKLAVTKVAPKTRYIGREIPYTLTVTNNGNGTAKATQLTDTLPAGATLVRASQGGRQSGNKVIWDLGNIEPKGTKTVTLAIKANAAGTLKNVAVAKAICTEAQAATETVVRGIPAILLECIDMVDPVEIGTQETYRIRVTNQGSAKDTNIDIVCTIPPEQTYVSSSGPTKATLKGNVLTFAPLPVLNPKAVATFKVVTKGAKAGDSRFKVSMTTDITTSPIMETESTHVYE